MRIIFYCKNWLHRYVANEALPSGIEVTDEHFRMGEEKDLVLIDPNSQKPIQHGNVQEKSVVPRNEIRNVIPQVGWASLIDVLQRAGSLRRIYELIPEYVAQYLRCRRVALYIIRDTALVVVSSTVTIPTNYSFELSDQAPEPQVLNGLPPVVVGPTRDLPMRIIAPLYGINSPLGELVIYPTPDEIAWGGGGPQPTPMHMRALEDISKVIALTIENYQLIEKNEKRADKMDLITRLTTAFNSSVLDLEAAIGIVERQIKRMTYVDSCIVVLGNNQRRDDNAELSWLRPEVIRQAQHMPAPTLLDTVSGSHLAHLLPESVKSFYAFPFVVEDRVVGLLALAFHTPHIMETNERDTIMIIANIASTALLRAKLYAEASNARSQARDLLERARNEERIKDAILRLIPSGFISTDLEGRVTLLNQQAAAILCVDELQVRGKLIEEVMPSVETDTHIVRAAIQAKIGPHKREVHIMTSKGDEIAIEAAVSPLRQADGKDIGVLCAFQDVTKLRALETEMKRMEHFAMMGVGSREISHDMSNILQGLFNAFNSIQEIALPAELSEQAGQNMKIARLQLRKLLALLDNMRNLTNPRPPEIRHIDATKLFEETRLSLMYWAQNNHVTLKFTIEPNIVLLIDEMQIARVLDNLCVNAIEAMRDGGTLAITVSSTRGGLRGDPVNPPSAHQVEGATEFLLPKNQSPAAEIIISDTGHGILEELLPTIWEPFKSFGKRGTGLGLAIVKRIIDDHGGTISVKSKVGHGTTFTIRLPSLRQSDRIERQQ